MPEGRFEGWTNQEIGAYVRGLEYINDPSDVDDILAGEAKQSPLRPFEAQSNMGDPDGSVATAAHGRPPPEALVDTITEFADQVFKDFFKDRATIVAHQISVDTAPFIELIEKRAADGLAPDEFRYLLLKMVVTAAASAIYTAKQLGKIK